MRYVIEDTKRGYRITLVHGAERIAAYEESGGHGPVEELYAEAVKVWEAVRPLRREHEPRRSKR